MNVLMVVVWRMCMKISFKVDTGVVMKWMTDSEDPLHTPNDVVMLN